MTTLHLSPGATVMSTPTHDGLERVSDGMSVVARLATMALAVLARWRADRIAAHNDAAMVALAAADHRVRADLAAARDRARG